MSFFWFAIIGLAAGALAGRIMTGSGFGFLGDLVVGVLGGVLGGVVFGLLGFSSDGLIGSFVTALVGAILLVYVIHVVKKE